MNSNMASAGPQPAACGQIAPMRAAAEAAAISDSERAHILFLIDVLYTTAGGAEGVLSKITRLLPADRYRCSIATFAPHTGLVQREAYPCPVHLLPVRRIYGWHAFKAACKLARIIRSQRVALVHTFFEASDLLGGVVAKISGSPILVSSRRDMGFQRSPAQNVAYRLISGLFDQVHAVAEEVRRFHIRQDGLDPAKVIRVYNGVDLEEIDRAPVTRAFREIGVADAAPVIVCVANIRPVKGLETLVRTAAIVRRRISDVQFLVIGAAQDSECFRSLTDLVAELGLCETVRFAGRRMDVPSILKHCDVFYLPSQTEGLSNAMLEAMACGLPCVATRVGGNRELVEHGRNGFLIPVEDPGAGAEAILALLGDRSRATAMGREGRRIVESAFSVEAMVARLTELYDGLLAARKTKLRRQSGAPNQ